MLFRWKKEDDFRCITMGKIDFESAKQISVELHHGHVKGHIDGHHWYRQAGVVRVRHRDGGGEVPSPCWLQAWQSFSQKPPDRQQGLLVLTPKTALLTGKLIRCPCNGDIG